MKYTPEEVALSEVNKRIVTKEQAKERFLKWVGNPDRCKCFGDDTVKFWKDVIIKAKQL
jgi:hypothetical protein